MEIQDALRPYDPDTFLREWWRRQPLAIERCAPHFYDDVLTPVQLEEILIHNRIRYPEIRLMKNGKKVSKESLMQWGWLDKIVPLDVKPGALVPLYEAYHNGYSLFLRAERVSHSVATFCRSVEEWLHHVAIGEVVLTPRESQSSPVHTDRHDVFAIQIHGTKHWRVYDPVGGDPSVPLSERVGEPLVDRVLNPGDLLYIPREYPHEALTSQDSASLHLSVAVHPTRWRDLMLEGLKTVLDTDPRFSEPLPARFLRDQSACPSETFRDLWDAALEQLDVKKAVAQLGTDFCFNLRPIANDQFGELSRLHSMTAESLLERRPGMLCQLNRKGESVKLAFPGNYVMLPVGLLSVLEAIVTSSGAFTPRSLPGKLDEPGRVVLMKHLMRAGLLRFAEAA